MPYTWPTDTDFALWELDVLDPDCSVCGRRMYICDHRYRRFHTLQGPVALLCRLDHCPDPRCPGHARTKSPETEITLAPLRDRLRTLRLDAETFTVTAVRDATGKSLPFLQKEGRLDVDVSRVHAARGAAFALSVAYEARKDKKSFVVWDGQEGKPYDLVGRPVLSPGGKEIAYDATKGRQMLLVRNCSVSTSTPCTTSGKPAGLGWGRRRSIKWSFRHSA